MSNTKQNRIQQIYLPLYMEKKFNKKTESLKEENEDNDDEDNGNAEDADNDDEGNGDEEDEDSMMIKRRR